MAIDIARNEKRKSSISAMEVSDLLRSAINDPIVDGHPVEKYAKALAGIGKKVTRFIGIGADSIAMELENGNVLKVSGRTLTDSMGSRSFDLPIVERGVVDTGSGLVYWFVQPKVQTPVTYSQFKAFKVDLVKYGYIMNDAGENQLGVYCGLIKLLDPFSVQKLD